MRWRLWHPGPYLGLWLVAAFGVVTVLAPLVLLSVFGEGLAGATAAGAASSASVPVAQIEPTDVEVDGVVRITTWTCDGRSSGSGFLTEYGVVTARHVVAGAVSVGIAPVRPNVVLELGEPVVIERRHADQIDAAVLVGPKGRSTYVVRNELPTLGEPLAVVGFPFGGDVVVHTGHLIDIAAGATFGVDAEHVLIVSAPAELGISGGPVLDADGRAVGVVSAVEKNTNTAIIVPIGELRPVLAGGGTVHTAADC